LQWSRTPDTRDSVTQQSPEWVGNAPLLQRAYALATEAHGSQTRATDQTLFVEHVLEVATLLHDAGFDEELIAAGLLHDAVERGTATERDVRAEMGDAIASLVMALTEDRSLESFAERKTKLRTQAMAAGPRATAIFAADKLSDIRGLQRGIDASRGSIEARMGTSIAAMVGHYRESVEMIESSDPNSCFVPALRHALEILTTPDKLE